MLGFYDPRAEPAVLRIVESFGIHDLPFVRTVGELIDYIADSTSFEPDTVLNIRRSPSSSEVRREIFRQLQEDIAAIGGRIPATIDAHFDLKDLLPVEQRADKWHEISERVHCELPILLPTAWWFGAVFSVVYALMLALWVFLLHTVQFLRSPSSVPSFIVNGFFFLVMYIGGFAVAFATAELASRRHLVPFNSLTEMVDFINQGKNTPPDESLFRQIETTIQDYVPDVVAEEYDIPREAIGGDFKLVQGYDEEGSI